MDFKNELLENVDKIHTTKLGIEGVKKNLGINCNNVVEYCIDLIEDNNSLITQKGKNYYVEIDNKIITVNKSSFTIITAHKIKKIEIKNLHDYSISSNLFSSLLITPGSEVYSISSAGNL
ncbi:DUF3781 domain-containing protein [Methanobrevibacter oralis]|uniref:Uncharacterized protein n=1 Tax=Methanobrevibacter oralis TaxID=66851 RepID=A0A162FD89_METOA|nr:DUF3781 domain-containing protein [Methanobrevibacter oralis]KZX11315.1 hypothetical protein MBORA_15600 [Methanobrevibacter oralis]